VEAKPPVTRAAEAGALPKMSIMMSLPVESTETPAVPCVRG
jgi:hypothetical protein